MKALGLASFAVCLVATFAIAGDDEAQKKEKAAIAGKWKIVSFETPDGNKDDLADATLEFDKDGKNMTFMKGDETKKGTFKLNPAGKPKEIDVMPENENKTFEGIYQLDKDSLKICLSVGNDGRPNELAVKDKKYVLITMERAK